MVYFILKKVWNLIVVKFFGEIKVYIIIVYLVLLIVMLVIIFVFEGFFVVFLKKFRK